MLLSERKRLNAKLGMMDDVEVVEIGPARKWIENYIIMQ